MPSVIDILVIAFFKNQLVKSTVPQNTNVNVQVPKKLSERNKSFDSAVDIVVLVAKCLCERLLHDLKGSSPHKIS